MSRFHQVLPDADVNFFREGDTDIVLDGKYSEEQLLKMVDAMRARRALLCPSPEHLASLLAALYFQQCNTHEEQQALNTKIENALRNYAIGTGEFVGDEE